MNIRYRNYHKYLDIDFWIILVVFFLQFSVWHFENDIMETVNPQNSFCHAVIIDI